MARRYHNSQVADSVPFSEAGYTAENVKDAITETNTKAGIISGASFSGGLKSYTVVFNTSYLDNNYAVAVIGESGRSWTIESKSASGFTINSNAGAIIVGNVFWITSRTRA